MREYILIPCKALTQGKSRLAGILSAVERQALCALLLRNTLGLARALQSARQVQVITPDAEIAAIAAEFGVGTIYDGGTSLNEALALGRAGILEESSGDAEAIILPIDLPYATADAVGRVKAREFDVVLAPDAERRGTNLLYLGSRALRIFPFAFGPGSFAAHRGWPERQGLRVATVDDPCLSFDIDRPADYESWQRAVGGASD